jgi:hypothetical protein
VWHREDNLRQIAHQGSNGGVWDYAGGDRAVGRNWVAQLARGQAAWSGGTPLPALLNAAGVADEQKEQIKAIAAEHRPALRSLTASYARRIRRSLMRYSQGAIRPPAVGRLPRSVVSLGTDRDDASGDTGDSQLISSLLAQLQGQPGRSRRNGIPLMGATPSTQ